MFVSVSNEQPLGICARVGMVTVLAYARFTHHGIHLQSLYGIIMTMYIVCFLYKGITRPIHTVIINIT